MPNLSYVCGHCGQGVSGEIVAGLQVVAQSLAVKCPLCSEISARNKNQVMYPPPIARRSVKHLPEDVLSAWTEAVDAMNAGAYTAGEIMCRKILMHVAVDVASAAPGQTFVQYIDRLTNAGYVTTGLKPKIDQIRTRGNVANHELPASTQQDCERTIEVTQHLLVSVYELPNS